MPANGVATPGLDPARLAPESQITSSLGSSPAKHSDSHRDPGTPVCCAPETRSRGQHPTVQGPDEREYGAAPTKIDTRDPLCTIGGWREASVPITGRLSWWLPTSPFRSLSLFHEACTLAIMGCVAGLK